jgi:hypothetical protein
MKLNSIIATGLAALTMGGAVLAPVTADAQTWRQHRAQKQNEWRNIALGSGAVGLLGLLTHDNTLTFGGAAGALYSYYRYDQDRRSTDRQSRLRAEYFSRPYFYRDGVRYDRRTIWRNGQRYYQFYRHR